MKTSKIYVRNLPDGCNTDELLAVFEEYGKDSTPILDHVPLALKMADHHNENLKTLGIHWLSRILNFLNDDLKEKGYDNVIFQSLIRTASFDDGQVYVDCLNLLSQKYFGIDKLQDEIMENILKKIASCNDQYVINFTLVKIMDLIDVIGDNLLKHSKQLLKLVDLIDMEVIEENVLERYMEICQELEVGLPRRRS